MPAELFDHFFEEDPNDTGDEVKNITLALVSEVVEEVVEYFKVSRK